VDPDDVAAHASRVLAMRARREAGLRDPTGWLSLVGLHWLAPGSTAFGADAGNALVLHAESGPLPPVAGSFEVLDDRVRVHPMPDGGLSLGGGPVPDGLDLVDDNTDSDDGPTILELASLRLHLIRRGGRLAIRVKDVAASALRAFEGIDCYPVDPAWRLMGRLESAEPGATIQVPDVIGDLIDEQTPGDVIFDAGGGRHRLHALESMPGHLWLIFADGTSGHETYGAGRFLVTGPVQADGSVEIDFNLAYNPPCVFSPYATCPLPPPGNRLALRVEAGERLPKGGTLIP
jgi:uncharacterized protein (DUF1684 family)